MSPAGTLVLEAESRRGLEHPYREVRELFCSIHTGDAHRQSELYQALIAAAHGGHLLGALRPRALQALALVCRLDQADLAIVDKALELLRREARHHSPIFILHLIRTWCNSWITSHRTQTGTAGCAWACSPVSTDCLAHYLCCSAMWGAIEKALHAPISKLARVGLDWSAGRPTRKRQSPLLPLAIAVQTYHRRDPSASKTKRAASASLVHQVSAALRQLGALR